MAVPHEAALEIRDDVGFFQVVRAVLAKGTPGERRTDEELDHAIRQIVSRAVVSDEVIDIFSAVGLRKPDISILSDEFLAEVRGMPQRNLAVELLRKLLAGEIKSRSRRNVVQARSFADLLEQVAAPLPEPRDRDRPGHRGADRPGGRHASGQRPRGRAWTHRR